jgi:hypothetical protein
VELLYEREQAMIDPIEDRAEIKLIKEQFVANLPQVADTLCADLPAEPERS